MKQEKEVWMECPNVSCTNWKKKLSTYYIHRELNLQTGQLVDKKIPLTQCPECRTGLVRRAKKVPKK